MIRTIAMLAAVAALVAGPARGGLLDSLKAKVKEEAKKKAMEVAKEKAAEMLRKKPVEPPTEPEDKFQGEYDGTYKTAGGQSSEAGATVVGYVDGKAKHWDIVVTTGEDKPTVVGKLKGTPDGEKVSLAGGGWTGRIADGKLFAKGDKGEVELKYTVRKSPTLGAKPPAGAIVLLPFEEGKPTSLGEWTNKKWVLCSDGSALVRGGSSTTKRKFRDFKVHIEFRCPFEPNRRGQGRGNSGCYMHSKYEVQVLDSFGLKPGMGDCGSIYGVRITPKNSSLPPGQWQTYDITFRGPRIGLLGKVKEWPKFVEVLHNGVKVHENVEVKKVTTGGKGGGHVQTGEIMLQDHGNPVRFRNIWLVETK